MACCRVWTTSTVLELGGTARSERLAPPGGVSEPARRPHPTRVGSAPIIAEQARGARRTRVVRPVARGGLPVADTRAKGRIARRPDACPRGGLPPPDQPSPDR